MLRPWRRDLRAVRFVSEYLKDFNGTKAAIRAGYTEKSASHLATSLLLDPEVSMAVGQGMERLLRYNSVTAERVMQELAHIAFFDPATIFDDNGKLLSIHQMPEYARRALVTIEIDELYRKVSSHKENVGLLGRVRWGNKLQALKMLARCLVILKEIDDKKLADPKSAQLDLHGRVFGRIANLSGNPLWNHEESDADDDVLADVERKLSRKA